MNLSAEDVAKLRELLHEVIDYNARPRAPEGWHADIARELLACIPCNQCGVRPKDPAGPYQAHCGQCGKGS